MEEAFSDIQELIDMEQLFTADVYKDYVIDFKKRKTVVKALCLHIAHDCNLACRYCFAEEGEYLSLIHISWEQTWEATREPLLWPSIWIPSAIFPALSQ